MRKQVNNNLTGDKTALLVIPTYNEAKNIGLMLTAVFGLEAVAESGWRLDVLVMDDSSPDGTGKIVQDLAETTYKDRLFLETGKKQGLGKALQRSFDAALRFSHDVVLTMDADFSHDPADIPKLLKAVDEGADVAVGSRYISGGLIPGNWPLGLIIRTRVATLVARWLGGVSYDLQELTTNFRAMRRHVLEKIEYNSITANGYGIQIFLANAFTKHGFVVREVPITFRDRLNGASKARLKDVTEFFKIAYQLNDDSAIKQTLRFLGVGLSGTVVNLVALWQLHMLFNSTAPILSLVAIQVSVVWNFVLHNIFTFKAYRQAGITIDDKNYFRRFVLYEAASMISQSVTFFMYTILEWAGTYFLVAQIVGIATAFAVNYYLSTKHIWTDSKKYAS